MSYVRSILFGALCLTFSVTSEAWASLSPTLSERPSIQTGECVVVLTQQGPKHSVGQVQRMPLVVVLTFKICQREMKIEPFYSYQHREDH